MTGLIRSRRPGRPGGVTPCLAGLVLGVFVSLGGCATVGSGGTDRATHGTPYYLPKTLFDVTLIKGHDDVTLEVVPVIVGDIRAGQLSLDYSRSVFSSDTIGLRTNEHGLLTSVNARMDSRAAEALGLLGRVAGTLQSGDTSPQITNIRVDPADADDLEFASGQLSRALNAWAARAQDHPRREEAARLEIALEWRWDNGLAVQHGGGAAPDCRGGACVRSVRPGQLLVWRCTAPATPPSPAPAACDSRNGVLVASYRTNIPNNAPPSRIALDGGIFANRTHDLTLVDGMVRSHRVTSQAELEGLGTAAVSFLSAQARAIAEAVQSDIALAQNRTRLIEAQTAQAHAQRALERALTDASEPEPNAANPQNQQQTSNPSAGVDAGAAGQQEPDERAADNDSANPETEDQGANDQGVVFVSGDDPDDDMARRHDPHGGTESGKIWATSLFGPS